ncbi:MAG: acetyl-CoA carboxylase carboxyltransferase subunit alpha [Pirellulaceae bacterium]|nr:acetyl-CoA carboxylase carboxyltransferase subunit alpha [Pirellulaceae bacterium]
MSNGSPAPSSPAGLEFEQPIVELEARRRALEMATERTPQQDEDLRLLKRQIADVTRQVYGSLTPWQTVQVARHKDRPYTSDYLALVFEDYVELHGDRRFGDDRAILTGFARLDQHKVLVVGHQKGRTYKERSACSFGCANPEGYRKAILKMKLAEKYGLPVICLIDTPGAFPGIGAEERGQSQAIAENMYEMSRLNTPVICLVIGEGGSGGALGIGVGDRVAMLEFSYYSVISPEGCAGILWKSHQYAEKAATALKFTSRDLLRLGVVDHVIEEPLGGAHRDHQQAAMRVKQYLLRSLRELLAQPLPELLAARYDKFRRMGVFLEESAGHASG